MKTKELLISPQNAEIVDFFTNKYKVIKTEYIKSNAYYEGFHADMQALNIHGNIFVNANSDFVSKLSCNKNNIIKCNDIGVNYPDNIALNAALIGKMLLCKENSLHPLVKKLCDELDIKIINVNQGYAKCSTLVLDDNSIITDDESIAKAAHCNNINVLKIEKGDIIIDNNTVGFIGGASAVIDDTVYFFGDINTHRNANEIINFIHSLGLRIICVKTGKLTDVGGIVVL